MTIDQSQHADARGLHLLFASGKRPTRAAIRDFVEHHRAVSIAYDPSEGTPLQLVGSAEQANRSAAEIQSDSRGDVWIELLINGLSFDLRAIAPGAAYEFPDFDHHFDMDRAPGAFRLETMRLEPGQHLAGAEATMPVVRGMIALARDLTHHFDDLVAIVWPPSRSAIGRRYFESISTAWLDGGAFPALGFTAFREAIDGALQSVGLDFWIGQELRIEPPLSTDKVAATRLAVRIINQLVIVGGLEESERIIAPDGSPLVMRPSRNRKFVRVWRE